MSKYGVFSGPYFSVFGTEKTPYLDTFHAVWARSFFFVFGLVLIWFYISCEYEYLKQILNLESQTPNWSKCIEIGMGLVTFNSPLNNDAG